MRQTDDYHGGAHEELGVGYPPARRTDRRIARRIHAALGDARSVANVGAGAGAYEPFDKKVLPIEQSQRMISQRAPELAPAIRGHAESLPLPSKSVDAALACMTLHDWVDWRIGVQELRRVARERVVVFTYDRACAQRFWLLRDYLTKLGRLDSARFPPIEEQRVAMGEEVDVEIVPIPHDCEDGFLAAHWRRPAAYLDERVRASISTFQIPGAARLLGGLDQLAEDLDTGLWEERNQELLDLEEIDLGYRLLIAEL
jgi:methyltransferase family protein